MDIVINSRDLTIMGDHQVIVKFPYTPPRGIPDAHTLKSGETYAYIFIGMNEYKIQKVDNGVWDILGKFESGRLLIADDPGHWPQ